MGYRSAVVLAVKHSVLHSLPSNYLIVTAKKQIREGVTYFIWNSIKWYEDYPEVRELLEWTTQQHEHYVFCPSYGTEVAPYGLICIGESYDDTEVSDYAYAYGLYINRTIEIE